MSMKWILEHSFWRYCIVGALGFAVDWSILQFCVRVFGVGPVVARVFSTFAALTATWLLHRQFTFSVASQINFSEWFRYMLSNGVGALVNFCVYSGMVLVWPRLGLTIPLAIASVVALAINYFGAAYFVFNHKEKG
jgi:putative flippase GtrA